MSKRDDAAGIAGGKAVLVCGASFAGLSIAYWMNRLGYRVTVVELANGLRKGGTPVDIRDGTVDIVKRMGLFDAIRSRSLPSRITEFKNAQGETDVRLLPQSADGGESGNGYEIERDVLLDLMFSNVEGDVEFVFGNSVSALTDTDDGVRASFTIGPDREFSLVFGCDGNHSSIRAMRFGEELEFSHFLKQYFSILIVDESITEENTTQVWSVPGRTMILNAYGSKADIVLSFYSEKEIEYDFRDRIQHEYIVLKRFSDLKWKAPDLLSRFAKADKLYFDKLYQIKIPCWSNGRVALVGDAAYCASPAAGMGGSLAIIGAAALADAVGNHSTDIRAAFAEYDHSLRPFIKDVQMNAVSFGLNIFFPRTEEAILRRNEQLSG